MVLALGLLERSLHLVLYPKTWMHTDTMEAAAVVPVSLLWKQPHQPVEKKIDTQKGVSAFHVPCAPKKIIIVTKNNCGCQ